MQRPTSVIMAIMAAASGSSTQPRRRAWSPKVNQVKLRTERKPGAASVDKNAVIDSARAAIWPKIARAAPVRRRELAKLRIKNEATNGTAGISQRLETIQEFIFWAQGENVQRLSSNARRPTKKDAGPSRVLKRVCGVTGCGR